MRSEGNTNVGWLEPPPEQQSLRRYVEAIRERIWLVALAVAVTTLAAIGYVITADKVYEADTQVVISPIEDPEGTLAALGLITESGDPLRAVETAATLLTSSAAAEQTAADLGLDRQPQSILRDITVEPIAESNVVSIVAEGSTGEEAAALANGFAEAAVAVRGQRIEDAIDAELNVLNERLSELPSGVARDTLAAEIAQLEALRASGDPTVQIFEPASEPGSPVSPRPVPSIIAGLLAGLVLGVGAVLAWRMLDPRLRREEQIRARYSLPILARVPQQRHPKHRPLMWGQMPAPAVESYRTLRAVLTTTGGPVGGGARSILITSAGPGEGKTTTAISLAMSLALTDKRVILIEGDLRRPTIGASFGVSVDSGMTSVLLGESTVDESLVPVPVEKTPVGLLLAEQGGNGGAELLSLPTAQQMLSQAKELADFVIVDSPPLATVVDALPLARSVDDIVLVAKLGTTRMDRIQELAEMLADSGIRPTGFTLIGVPSQPSTYYADGRQHQVAALSATRSFSRAN